MSKMTEDEKFDMKNLGLGVLLTLAGIVVVCIAMFGWAGVGAGLLIVGVFFISISRMKSNPNDR